MGLWSNYSSFEPHTHGLQTCSNVEIFDCGSWMVAPEETLGAWEAAPEVALWQCVAQRAVKASHEEGFYGA